MNTASDVLNAVIKLGGLKIPADTLWRIFAPTERQWRFDLTPVKFRQFVKSHKFEYFHHDGSVIVFEKR
jgi:hypothetical protein